MEEVRDAAVELKQDRHALLRYLISPEAHVFAFSIAANVLLAFFPFLLVMVAACRHVLHWPEAERAIQYTVKDFFAGTTGDFIWSNLMASAGSVRKLEWVSLLLLLFTANGVFLPLEVALNRAWGVKENRSLLKNQIISMGLIFGCGALALISGALTASGMEAWQAVAGVDSSAPEWLIRILAKIASIPVTILILLLIYSFVPNTKVPIRLVLPRTIVIGFVLEGLKWLNLLVWSWLYDKFGREYGPFKNTVTIITWSFVAGLIVLAGADWTARRARFEAAKAEASAAAQTAAAEAAAKAQLAKPQTIAPTEPNFKT